MEGKVVIFNHPLMHHKLTLIRDEKTCTKDFRETVEEIAMLMAYEVTRNLPTVEKKIKTPIDLTLHMNLYYKQKVLKELMLQLAFKH